MARIDQPKISNAIHACLQRCYKEPDCLLARIAEFLDELQYSGGWAQDELRAVEKGVRKVLIFGVLDGATYSGDATSGDDSAGGSKTAKVNGA
jgi:hypothetical protein